jgi:NAD(P)-dependent dehydrogenase (short-subunit alcohol dehydrogenase family)
VPKPFVEYTPEGFHRVVSTNLAGFFYVSQEAARHMRQRGSGPIPRLATVQEIDAALLVRAPFITGEVLYVDGGAHADRW